MSEDIIKINTKEAIEVAEEKIKTVSPLMSLKVVSQPTFEEAIRGFVTIREVKKFLKEKKDSVLRPLKEATENLKALFEPAETSVLKAETYLKNQTDKYVAKLREEEALRIKEAEKKIDKGAPIENVVKKLENTQEKIAKIPTRKYWRLKVVDFSKVPDEFKTLDESKALKAASAGLKVEGLEFYQEEKTINAF